MEKSIKIQIDYADRKANFFALGHTIFINLLKHSQFASKIVDNLR